MTTFERLYIADPAAHREIKDPDYRHIAARGTAERILREFGLAGAGCHSGNGHVPVRAIEGESPIKGGGRLKMCIRDRPMPAETREAMKPTAIATATISSVRASIRPPVRSR